MKLVFKEAQILTLSLPFRTVFSSQAAFSWRHSVQGILSCLPTSLFNRLVLQAQKMIAVKKVKVSYRFFCFRRISSWTEWLHINTAWLRMPMHSNSEIADHLPVFTISYDHSLSPFPNKIKIRDFKRFNNIAFQKALRNANWHQYTRAMMWMKA